MTVTFKKAFETDAALVIELLGELYMELGEEAESIRFLTGDFVAEILRSGSTDTYFVEKNGTIVGLFTLTESQAFYAGGKYGSLDEMYIRPGHRCAGIGRQCIAHIQKTAQLKKWQRIDVTAPTDKKWERTFKFYVRRGFVYTGPKLKLKI